MSSDGGVLILSGSDSSTTVILKSGQVFWCCIMLTVVLGQYRPTTSCHHLSPRPQASCQAGIASPFELFQSSSSSDYETTIEPIRLNGHGKPRPTRLQDSDGVHHLQEPPSEMR